MERIRFEVWISTSPYEYSLDRENDDDAWPGQYKEYQVQLAWEAWLYRANHESKPPTV